MDADACFQVGYIAGTHGLSGEINALLDVDQPEAYYDLESVFLQKKKEKALIPFFVQYLKPQGNKLTIKFEEISSLEEAKLLVGSTVYLPLEWLPDLKGSAFYFHEVVNCQVEDSRLGTLGSVSGIYDQTAQVLIGMDYKGYEVLIPYNEEVVLGLDRERNILMVTLPEGLLELYLES